MPTYCSPTSYPHHSLKFEYLKVKNKAREKQNKSNTLQMSHLLQSTFVSLYSRAFSDPAGTKAAAFLLMHLSPMPQNTLC